jgi:pimeloyl-ACP methyl ester carboxylesterase
MQEESKKDSESRLDHLPYRRELKYITTSYGKIAYTEQGTGPVALFLHGIFLNGYLWHRVIERLSDARRCIAIDLLAHGGTEAAEGHDLSFESQTEMVAAFCDALGFHRVDLVGNDSGGGIAQIFATRYESRLRSLTLTNCDTHDNCPPAALQPLMDAASAGQLLKVGGEMLANPQVGRQALGIGYEHPELVGDDTIRTYLEPIFGNSERARQFEDMFRRCFLAPECHQTFVLDRIGKVQTPTLIVWGTADPFFPITWAHWLRETIPGSRALVMLEDARLFLPEERPDELSNAIREHWSWVDEMERGLSAEVSARAI